MTKLETTMTIALDEVEMELDVLLIWWQLLSKAYTFDIQDNELLKKSTTTWSKRYWKLIDDLNTCYNGQGKLVDKDRFCETLQYLLGIQYLDSRQNDKQFVLWEIVKNSKCENLIEDLISIIEDESYQNWGMLLYQLANQFEIGLEEYDHFVKKGATITFNDFITKFERTNQLLPPFLIFWKSCCAFSRKMFLKNIDEQLKMINYLVFETQTFWEQNPYQIDLTIIFYLLFQQIMALEAIPLTKRDPLQLVDVFEKYLLTNKPDLNNFWIQLKPKISQTINLVN